ncbi:MAG: bifunctional hydroxymethylpyrimidine kinase/phosphomethylpyrimidine kinase [Sandaracinaceae bacterium]|nr:bifunctional hydroxymethylpyrimidine kinase/phosphomethylpyrimidine kinase [Sandaracinaceae bacterium]
MVFVALTIAGSDPSGGAGLQADLKTFHQHSVYGEAVVTLLTVQNTRGVTNVTNLDAALVESQIRAVCEDIPPHAVKTGALGSRAVVERVGACAPFLPNLVVDPVMISKHGAKLLAQDAVDAFCASLLPRALLVTPNTHEAEALCGKAVRTVAEAREAALRILDHGCRAVLVKGGHLDGPPVDVLCDAGTFYEFTGDRIATNQTHGTGCTLSAAITAHLARGTDLVSAVRQAKSWLSEALRTAVPLGHGVGPVNHLAPVHPPLRT